MEGQPTKGRLAVNQARSSSDLVVLLLTFIVFVVFLSIYFVIQFFTSAEFIASSKDFITILVGLLFTAVGGLFVFGMFLLMGMFMVRIQRQTMLGNSLQVEYSNFAWLRDWANIVSADLEMPRVEIFITQDPLINAYSFGFIRPYTIVLHSGSIRYLTPEELKAVVVHEMAHIKYGHTAASVYLLPFLTLPVINVMGTWLAGFWQRRSELTADRLALMYTGDAELVKLALIKVHVGPDVADAMNDVARQWLQYTAERPMNRFAQTFSTHPFLVRRLSHIDRWKDAVQTIVEPQSQDEPAVAK